MARAEHSIITFYSYKGGTGRTATMANVAWLLACSGLRVCVVDWDLEAPGLHRYLRPFLEDSDLELTDGLLDWLWAVSAHPLVPRPVPEPSPGGSPSLLDYVVHIDAEFGSGALDFIPAGRQDADYAKRVTSFEWTSFYERLGGAQVIEEAARQLRQEYDFVLIDSRTGVSDTAGICTIQLPDRLVACYTLNRQSIEGVDGVLASIRKQREGGRPLTILPLAMRIDTSEKQKLEDARAEGRRHFGVYLGKDLDQATYWESMEVQYWPFYNFEECLAVFGDDPANRSVISMLSTMERVARQVSEVPTVKAPPVDAETRRQVLARYGFGANAEPAEKVSTEQSLADGPEIFSEAYLRYREWTRDLIRSNRYLLPGPVLDQLDAYGGPPRVLRADSAFMTYLIRSRDRRAFRRRYLMTMIVVLSLAGAAAAFTSYFVVKGTVQGLLLAAGFLGVAVAIAVSVTPQVLSVRERNRKI